MRIAVVGAGISGLVAARGLAASHDLTVFEQSDVLGGHTHTVDVTVSGRSYPVDTGFMVFNDENYPELARLLHELGVPSRVSDMSFSVRSELSGVEYCGSSVGRLFAQRRNLVRPRFWRMIRDIRAFNRLGRSTPVDAWDPQLTVGDLVIREGFGAGFVEDHLQPLGASLWSCEPGAFRTFPVRFLMGFLANHRMLAYYGRPVWKTVLGGARRYIEPLARPFAHSVRLNTPVLGVRRDIDGVHLRTAEGSEMFDHVVLACHTDQALSILDDPDLEESEALRSIPYQENDVVLHTDTSVLPRRRGAWASWNYLVRADRPEVASVTYDVSRLQGHDTESPLCVSLNLTDRIAPERILARRRFSHPVFRRDGVLARERVGALQGHRRTSYCGAWLGFGFHEDGVRSGMEVAARLLGDPVR